MVIFSGNWHWSFFNVPTCMITGCISAHNDQFFFGEITERIYLEFDALLRVDTDSPKARNPRNRNI